MLHIDCRSGIKEDAQGCLRICYRRSENHLILLPLSGIYRDSGRCIYLGLSHRGLVYQFHSQACISFRDTGPHTETVLSVFLQTDSEESVIHHSGMLMRMTRIHQPDIVGITIKRSVIHHLQTSSDAPALKPVVRKLERPVLDEFGIQASISGKIYILDEDAVHSRLDPGHSPAEIHLHFVHLGRNDSGRRQSKKR